MSLEKMVAEEENQKVKLEEVEESLLGNEKIKCNYLEYCVPFYKNQSGDWCYITVIDTSNDSKDIIQDKQKEEKVLKVCKEKMIEEGYSVRSI